LAQAPAPGCVHLTMRWCNLLCINAIFALTRLCSAGTQSRYADEPTPDSLSVPGRSRTSAPEPKPKPKTPVTVACIGDSITFGLLASPGHNYPAQLQALLGPEYQVINFGVSGKTMLDNGHSSYWRTEAFRDVFKSQYDVIIILLGTDDAKYSYMPFRQQDYAEEYSRMVETFLHLSHGPLVYAAVPPPIYNPFYQINETVVNRLLPPLIRRTASLHGLPPAIDLFAAFSNRCPDLTRNDCEWFGDCGNIYCRGTLSNLHDDGCHPNDEGYLQIAKLVHVALLDSAELIQSFRIKRWRLAQKAEQAQSVLGGLAGLARWAEHAGLASPYLVLASTCLGLLLAVTVCCVPMQHRCPLCERATATAEPAEGLCLVTKQLPSRMEQPQWVVVDGQQDIRSFAVKPT